MWHKEFTTCFIKHMVNWALDYPHLLVIDVKTSYTASPSHPRKAKAAVFKLNVILTSFQVGLKKRSSLL